MLTITLDESDCFAAWVSAKDAGFSSPDGSDPKCTFLLVLVLYRNKKSRMNSSICYKIFQCQISCWLVFRYVFLRLNSAENSPIKMLFFSEIFQLFSFFLFNLVLGLQKAKGKSNISQLRAITETRECYSM